MAAFDAITEAPPPSRTWEDDEDELFRKHYSPVTLEWEESGEVLLRGGGVICPEVLVLGVSSSASLLLSHFPSHQRQFVGAITFEELPTRSTSGEAHMADSEGLASSKAKKVACAIYLLRTEADQNSDSANTVLISLPAETALPPEMSLEWIRVLFTSIKPRLVVAFASLLTSNMRGLGGDDEGQLFRLHTCTLHVHLQEGSNLKHPAIQAEYLPSGHLVDGVAAAVMSYCEARGLAAILYVSVQQSAFPSIPALTHLSRQYALLLAPYCNKSAEALEDSLSRCKIDFLGRPGTMHLADMYV